MEFYRSHRELLCIRLGNYCNLSCKGCLSNSNPYNKRESISEEKMKNLLSRLKHMGIRKISYSGGEPLLITNLDAILTIGANLGLNQIVTTNGTLPLNGRINGTLVEYTKFSLWGDIDFYENYFSRELFNRICTNINLSLDYGYVLGLNVIVTASMMNRLEDFINQIVKIWPKLDNIVLHGYLPSIEKDPWKLTDNHKKEIQRIIEVRKELENKPNIKFLDLESIGGTYITIDQDGRIEMQNKISSKNQNIGNLYNMSINQFSNLLEEMWRVKYSI